MNAETFTTDSTNDCSAGTKRRIWDWQGNQSLKTAALYFSMVIVSTITIFALEHATLLNAFRTAMVAAVGKTFAAMWVTSFFD